MAELKTQKTRASVSAFLGAVPDPARRKDCLAVARIMKQVTKAKPRMWGTSIVGFGDYHYKSAAIGCEGDWFVTGFSPRKQALTLYVMAGFEGRGDLMKKLGKHKTSGGGCLYIGSLADVDVKVLTELIRKSVSRIRAQAPN